MSFSTLEYRDAARKANAHLDMLASLDKVYADPACRSLLKALSDDDVFGHLSHDTVGDNRIHVERVLSYFQTANAPEPLPARKAHKNTKPCGPCSISKVKCLPVNALVGLYPCQRCQKHETAASCKPKSDPNVPINEEAASSTSKAPYSQRSVKESLLQLFSDDSQANMIYVGGSSIPTNTFPPGAFEPTLQYDLAAPTFQPQAVYDYADSSNYMHIETSSNLQSSVSNTHVNGSSSEDLPSSWPSQENTYFNGSFAE